MIELIKTRLGIAVICSLLALIFTSALPIYMYNTYTKTGPEAEMYEATSKIRLKYRLFLENDQIVSYNRPNDFVKTISVKSDNEEAKFTIGNLTEENENQNNAGFINFDLSEGKEVIVNVELKTYEVKDDEDGVSVDICQVEDLSIDEIEKNEKCELITETLNITVKNDSGLMSVTDAGNKISVSKDLTDDAIKGAKMVMSIYGNISLIENPFTDLEAEIKKISGLEDTTLEVIDFKGSVESGKSSGFQEFYFEAVKKYVTDSTSQDSLFKAIGTIISKADKITIKDIDDNVVAELVVIESELVKSPTTGFYYSQYMQAEKISYSGNNYEPNKWMATPGGKGTIDNGYNVISFGLQYTILVKRTENNGSFEASKYLNKIEGLF